MHITKSVVILDWYSSGKGVSYIYSLVAVVLKVQNLLSYNVECSIRVDKHVMGYGQTLLISSK